MTNLEETNLVIVRMYLAALQTGEAGEGLKRFFADEVKQVELPNRLNPSGQESDLTAVLKRSDQGLKVLRQQRYEIVSAIAQDTRVAVEALWTGVLAIPFGTLSAGTEMKAHLAVFFELSGWKIILQHNYDCFEPC